MKKVFKLAFAPSIRMLAGIGIVCSGTLKNPSVGIDPAKVLVRGGIAVGTAGISILAKGALDRLGNTAPLCDKMREELEKSSE
ncbi:MAG: hypothetical protein L3J22_08245 [Xanthomonadales bacterium]|nr:hypothetical protein [Xanthomonadales bacterium]